MAKSINYKVTLYPAQKDGAFVATKFEMMRKYPEQVTQIATQHGEGCQASVRCLAQRNPRGFKKATEGLYFNLEVKPVGTASAA